jgi:hypothetical protein
MSWFLTVRNFKLLEPYEGKLSCTVLRGESSRKGTDLPGKVQRTILMVGEISDIYVHSFQKMLSDPNYSIEELNAIANGYTRLLEQSNDVLSELKGVVNISTLSLSDKDRIDVVNSCYDAMLDYRNLVRYYTNKNIGVSYLRAKKKGETARVNALYGNPSDRYW